MLGGKKAVFYNYCVQSMFYGSVLIENTLLRLNLSHSDSNNSFMYNAYNWALILEIIITFLEKVDRVVKIV